MAMTSPRGLARLGVACVAMSLALFAWLHLTPPSAQVDWRTRTLSQYALLENGWTFDVATLLLAAGSAAVLAALIRAARIGPRSGTAAGVALWIAGLVGVVLFEKHDWTAGPSMNGDIHRVASLLAFLSLPVGALLTRSRAIVLAGLVSLLCFSPILWALAAQTWTGERWWRAIPLGTVERALCASEVITLLLMAAWAARHGDTGQPSRGDRGSGAVSAAGRGPRGKIFTKASKG
jgi:hypothetical protein